MNKTSDSYGFLACFSNANALHRSLEGSVRYYGLTPTSMKLEGLDRHQRLIDSYKKLHLVRSKFFSTSR